ncbi:MULTISPECIES: response regulator [Microbacterium]|uniref:Response regulator n=1 Tax=Microbacterium resistens TaxID=156977 RepID=A0ABY3RTE7_9MICO|nr:response regulator [Microbacterium resistens]MBW1637585.1 response regulator [Microbacterium resistens]MDA4895095.1 hypothetical protein [Streptomyces sp. MS2A]UGS27072.1 response regulator [Microbacterium resistens]
MALARLHGGPLDGQILPLDDVERDALIVPYSETQIIYRRGSEPTHTGQGDGPTEVGFWYTESEGDISPGDD